MELIIGKLYNRQSKLIHTSLPACCHTHIRISQGGEFQMLCTCTIDHNQNKGKGRTVNFASNQLSQSFQSHDSQETKLMITTKTHNHSHNQGSIRKTQVKTRKVLVLKI